MNDLDEKLDKAIARARMVYTESMRSDIEATNRELREAVKQTFKDAGYIDAKRMVEVANLLQQQAEILKNMANVNEKSLPIYGDGLTVESEYAIQYDGNKSFHFAGDINALKETNGFMTGQEWYDRLQVELKMYHQGKPELLHWEDRELLKVFDLAAKRAVGLE